MGKQGANKLFARAVQAVAAPVSPPPVSPPEPTEEELEAERLRQEQRDAKGRQEERKAANDRWYRERREARAARDEREAQRAQRQHDIAFKQVLSLAKDRGVLGAAEWDNGFWYVDLGNNEYKQVDDEYYCSHCEITLSWCALENHVKGERHRKKSGLPKDSWSTTAPLESEATDSTTAALEDWQELASDGQVRCKPCNRICDGCHGQTTQHLNKLADFRMHQANAGYPPPVLPWLAWAPCDWDPCRRTLVCLLCNGKEIYDLEGRLTEDYCGTHGKLSDSNQNNHKKKRRRLNI
eukprot:TRINITY_DN76117_c0_g1_i1.p1 TRINITY_DN76117_c0_g1~~TRINITY_DN76117_c0_g1_i1.p1  ORF type:complete len:309 (+),score=53.47 TRINITY_DN76117_c0_g1_i1:44-928(+)